VHRPQDRKDKKMLLIKCRSCAAIANYADCEGWARVQYRGVGKEIWCEDAPGYLCPDCFARGLRRAQSDEDEMKRQYSRS